MPGLAFPLVGRLGLTSPPSLVLCSATTAACPSRCPVLSLVHRYLVCSVGSCPFFKLVAAQERLRQRPACLVTRYAFSGLLSRRQVALPSSQATPFELMPCSSTPVVSCSLALACPGLLPSASLTASAFPSKNWRLSYRPQLYKFRGSITRPVFLLPLASDFRCRLGPQGSLLPCWLDFGQVGLAPTG